MIILHCPFVTYAAYSSGHCSLCSEELEFTTIYVACLHSNSSKMCHWKLANRPKRDRIVITSPVSCEQKVPPRSCCPNAAANQNVIPLTDHLTTDPCINDIRYNILTIKYECCPHWHVDEVSRADEHMYILYLV